MSRWASPDRAVVAYLPLGRLGLSVCYDLRFAGLYRSLAYAGAEFLAFPSAFTKTTGEAHWHVLVRARAIVTGSYITAACQCGVHAGGAARFGHTLIVNPWGKLVADSGAKPEIDSAEIHPDAVVAARQRVPALSHDRAFEAP